jgi:hypothetical protein
MKKNASGFCTRCRANALKFSEKQGIVGMIFILGREIMGTYQVAPLAEYFKDIEYPRIDCKKTVSAG